MKKYINLLMISIYVAVLATSCKKYLDEKSNSSLSVPNTIEDLQALLDDAGKMNIRITPGLGQASCDDYYLLENTYNGFSQENSRRTYTWRPIEYGFAGTDWPRIYLAIYNTNTCLEQINNIPVNDSNRDRWNNVKGSALFYRSYYFLNLAWEFAKAYDENSANTDLGIILRLTTDINVPSKRSNVKETYERILEDTKEAVPYLPEAPVHVFRPSKAAAYGLLARIYLSMRNYDSAFKYSNLCLQLSGYLIDYNTPDQVNLKSYTQTSTPSPFVQFNRETIFYTEMTGGFANYSTSIAKIDTILFNSYNNDDLRRKAYFRPFSGWRFKGSYAASTSVFFTGIATDEMILTRAECYVRLGQITEGMGDLNALMQKRWNNLVPYPEITAADAADALSKVLMERRKELVMRGLRWMDIKRLNKEGANIILTRIVNGETFTLLPNADYYALPLPADIVAITGVQQN